MFLALSLSSLEVYTSSSMSRVGTVKDNGELIHPAGGTGIGLIIAKALEANGAKKVFITGRRQDRLDAAAKQAVRAHQM